MTGELNNAQNSTVIKKFNQILKNTQALSKQASCPMDIQSET